MSTAAWTSRFDSLLRGGSRNDHRIVENAVHHGDERRLLAAAKVLHRLEAGDRHGQARLARDRRLLAQAAPQAVPVEEWFSAAPWAARDRSQPIRAGSAVRASEKSSGVSAAHVHAMTRALRSIHGQRSRVADVLIQYAACTSP